MKYQNREGIQAGNDNRVIEALRNNYVVEGCEVTVDEDFTLQVDSGIIVQDGEEYEIDGSTVEVSEPDEEPRKDVVYVNSQQELVVASGGDETAQPSLEEVEDKFHTATPSPPSLRNVDDPVVLAEVFVEDGATSLSAEDDLRERRLFVDIADSSVGDTFTINWSLIDVPDLEEQYGHGPIEIEGEKTVEVYEVNIANENGNVPEGLKIQLFDIEGDSEEFDNRTDYVELEFENNYSKEEPIASTTVENQTVVFTLVNDSGSSQFAGGFVKVRISG